MKLAHSHYLLWYRVRGSNPSLEFEGLSAYPEAPTRYILVLSKRIELMSIGYQPIALAIELQEELWWTLMESNHLASHPT